MKIPLVLLFLGVCSRALGQGLAGFGGLGDPGILGTSGGGATTNNALMPAATLSLLNTDPTGASMMLPLVAQQNPSMLQNPMGMIMLGTMMGIDLHKVVAPAMMAQQSGGSAQGGGMMRFMLPMMMSGMDAHPAMMLPMLLGGGSGGGMFGGNPLASMLLGHAAA